MSQDNTEANAPEVQQEQTTESHQVQEPEADVSAKIEEQQQPIAAAEEPKAAAADVSAEKEDQEEVKQEPLKPIEQEEVKTQSIEEPQPVVDEQPEEPAPMSDAKKNDEAQRLLSLANQALNSVTKGSIQELKALKSPPQDVHFCLGFMTSILNNKAGCAEWVDSQKAMANPVQFSKNVVGLMDHGRKLSDRQKKSLKLISTKFTFNEMAKKSFAAACIVEFATAFTCYIDFVEANGVNTAGLSRPAEAKPIAAVQRDPNANVELSDTIVIEHCINCKSHNTHLRHDEQKYLQFAQNLSAAIAQELGKSAQVVTNEVPKAWVDSDAYSQLIPCEDDSRQCYSMIPRLGAFEVTHKGIILFSKLLCKQWPHYPTIAKKVAACLKDSANGESENALAERYQTRAESRLE